MSSITQQAARATSGASGAGGATPPRGLRTFLILWASQSISVIGTALTFFATTVYLTQEMYPAASQQPQLAASLSIVALSFALPTLFFVPIAGASADRYDRRRIMLTTNVLAGCLSAVLVGLILGKALELWVLALIQAGFAVLQAFHGSAFDASAGMIVPAAQLPRANGMMQTMWSLSGVLSPGIAATLIALPAMARQGTIPGAVGALLARMSSGTALAVTIDALTFFVAATVLAFLTIPSPVRTDLRDAQGKVRKNMLADIKEGAVYIVRRRPLVWLLGTFAVINFCAGPLGVVQPLVLKLNLAADWGARGFSYETALALLATAAGAGGVAGGLFISAWGGFKTKRVYAVLGGAALSGLAGIAYGFSRMLYLSAGSLAVASFLLPLMNAHSQTIWQTQTPRELQGRVFSVRRVIAQFTWPMSAAFAGWAAGRFNPGMLMAVLYAVMTVFCLAQLLNPAMRRVEDREYIERLALGAEGRRSRGRGCVNTRCVKVRATAVLKECSHLTQRGGNEYGQHRGMLLCATGRA